MDRFTTDDIEDVQDDGNERTDPHKGKRKAKRKTGKGNRNGNRGNSSGSDDFSGVTWLTLTRHIVFAVLALVAAGAGYWWRTDVIAWLGWSVVPLGVWTTAFAYVFIARTGWFVKRSLPILTSGLVMLGAVGILGIFAAPLGSAMGDTMGGRLAEYVVREPFTWDRYNPSWWLPVQAWARVGVLFAIGLLGQIPSGYSTGAKLTGIGAMMGMSATISGIVGFASIMGGLFKNRKRPVATETDESHATGVQEPAPVIASMSAYPTPESSDIPEGHPLNGVADPESSEAAAAFKGNATEDLDYSGVRRDGNSTGLGSSYQSAKERVVFGMGQTLVSKTDTNQDSEIANDPPPFRDVSEVLESPRESLDAVEEVEIDENGYLTDEDVESRLDDADEYEPASTAEFDAGTDEESTAVDDPAFEGLSEELASSLEAIGAEFAEDTTTDVAEDSAMAFDRASDLADTDSDLEGDVHLSGDTPMDAIEEEEDPALVASRLEAALIDFPWHLPPSDSLKEAPSGGVTAAEIEATSELIEESLSQHGVEVSVDQIRVGPTVTMYGLKPGWKGGGPQSKTAAQRVRVDTILNREKDIALALKCPNIRFESVVPGASVVGIEVPNADPTPVNLRSVMDTEQWQEFAAKAALPVPLGMGSGGDPVMADFATMPHTLVAGATGSGKSVCINTIVTGLLLCRNPMQVRMVMIDPKRVELTPYQGIPHLYSPVVVEPTRALAVLKALTREMMERFAKLEAAGVKNITHFNERSQMKMPYLLIIVDELADLMLTSGNEVEQVLVRLAQLGRATGVHLVVATQRPSVDVVTGLIKANFPSRISFSVMSQVDSRTILDSNGADKLLGKGDMLYKPINLSSPMRVQGAFLAEEEIESVVGFWTDGGSPPLPQLELDLESEGGDAGVSIPGLATDGEADLLREASQLAQGQKTLSTSYLQRKLKIGYPRAARLMDDLEDAGVVGPGEPGKPRKVLQNTM